MSPLDPLTLSGLLRARAQSAPDLDILTIDGGDNRLDETRTCADLWNRGRALGLGLLGLGLRHGDMFGLLMANHPEFVESMVAAAATGTVFVPIDPRTRGERLAYQLGFAGCRGVIVADYALPGLAEIRHLLPSLEWIVAVTTGEADPAPDVLREIGAVPFTEVAGGDPEALSLVDIAPDTPMQLLYTSGTTGDPKGIVMTHRRFCETAALASRMFGYRDGDRPYSGLSLTHANAQVLTLGASLSAGLRCVLSRRFTKSGLWDITRRHGCTSFNLLGGMTTAVYAETPREDDADNPVRFVVSAGMPKAIWADFERRFNLRVLEFYGAAEGGLTIKPIGAGPEGSIGKPVPTLRYRIVDDSGHDVPRGQPGELLFRHADGAPFQVEYFRNPEASARKCRDGWLHMGDIVVEDEDGWLYFLYRAGGGIRRNGDFVDPALIEKTIAEIPDVEDVHVYGIAAASGAPGEKDIVAAVVPRPGTAFDPQALFRTCRSRLPANSVPGQVQVLEQIPKTASEKPQERFLIEELCRAPSSIHTEHR